MSLQERGKVNVLVKKHFFIELMMCMDTLFIINTAILHKNKDCQ